jgi:hypothetical protein
MLTEDHTTTSPTADQFLQARYHVRAGTVPEDEWVSLLYRCSPTIGTANRVCARKDTPQGKLTVAAGTDQYQLRD